MEDLRKVSPEEFENLVVEWYGAQGHRARRVGGQADHGVDVTVQAANGEKWIVQCKRWRRDVGEPVVRDFFGALHHEGADRGAIITTGRFTPQARAWARGKPLDLYEGQRFLDELRKVRPQGRMQRPAPLATAAATVLPLQVPAPVLQAVARSCPRCGAPMVLREAQKGRRQGQKFYGCSNYPRCREIIDAGGNG